MYRVGVAPLYVKTLEWSREKKITILKGNKEQRLEGMIGGIDVGSTNDTECFGFEFRRTLGIQLSPHSIQRLRNAKVQTEPWSVIEQTNLDDPSSPFALKMECTIGTAAAFFVELSFDFDSRPCALFYRGESRRNLWTISDEITESNKKVQNGQDYRQCQLTNIPEEDSDEDFYFLRATIHDDIFARLPDTLVAAQSAA
jgi:hypothetical protein